MRTFSPPVDGIALKAISKKGTQRKKIPFYILCPVAFICNLLADPVSNDQIKATPNGQSRVWGLQWKRQIGPSKGSASKGFGPISVLSLSNDLAYELLTFIITVLYADGIKNRHFQNLFAGLQWKVNPYICLLGKTTPPFLAPSNSISTEKCLWQFQEATISNSAVRHNKGKCHKILAVQL